MIERTIGETVGFSIGTAIPIEEVILLEKNPVKTLWLNGRTLFRNFYEAIDKDKRNQYSIADITKEFIEEVDNLIPFLNEQGVRAKVYNTLGVSTMKRRIPDAKVKLPKTPQQIKYVEYEKFAVENLMSLMSKEVSETFKVKLYGPIKEHVHILTHLPIDLLSEFEFGKLSLLESHTGTIKTRSQWITKITKNEEYAHLPVNILTIVVLGDRTNNFYALSPSIKKELLEISKQAKWTPMTSFPIVKKDVKKYAQSHSELFLRICNTLIN